jgi:hypothetical protein
MAHPDYAKSRATAEDLCTFTGLPLVRVATSGPVTRGARGVGATFEARHGCRAARPLRAPDRAGRKRRRGAHMHCVRKGGTLSVEIRSRRANPAAIVWGTLFLAAGVAVAGVALATVDRPFLLFARLAGAVVLVLAGGALLVEGVGAARRRQRIEASPQGLWIRHHSPHGVERWFAGSCLIDAVRPRHRRVEVHLAQLPHPRTVAVDLDPAAAEWLAHALQAALAGHLAGGKAHSTGS